MNVVVAVALGLAGVVAGAFVNLLIDRIPDKKPLRPLALALRPAGARGGLVQATCGLLWVGAWVRLGADWALPAYLVLFTSLLAISVIDLDLHIIPNRLVYPTIFVSIPLLGIAALVGDDLDAFKRALLGATLAWLALLVIHLVSPGGMGFGDVRLSFVLGLFLGWFSLRHVLVGIFGGFVLGALIGVLLIALRIRGRKDAIPFGPFLAAATVLVVLWGDPVIRWWLG